MKKLAIICAATLAVVFVLVQASAIMLEAANSTTKSPTPITTTPNGIYNPIDVNVVGGSSGYAEDTAIAAGENITMAGVVRQDTLASLTSATGARTELQVNELGRAYTNAAPIYDADTKTDCVAITAADADFTLSTVSDSFMVCASGNTAYITCADATPGVTTSVGGFAFAVEAGQCRLMNIKESTCAIIGTAAAGFVCLSPVK